MSSTTYFFDEKTLYHIAMILKVFEIHSQKHHDDLIAFKSMYAPNNCSQENLEKYKKKTLFFSQLKQSIDDIHNTILLLIDVGIIGIINKKNNESDIEEFYNSFFKNENSSNNQTKISINYGTKFFNERLSRGSEREIGYYILFGLKINSDSYEKYGMRKDITFTEKIRMFNIFYEKCNTKPDDNYLTHTINFSQSIEEVKKFMIWGIERNGAIKISMTDTCHKFGTELIKFMFDKYNVTINHLHIFLCNNQLNTEFKINYMNEVAVFYPRLYRCDEDLLNNLLDHKNFDIELYFYLIDHDAFINITFLSKLIFTYVKCDELTYSFVIALLGKIFSKKQFLINYDCYLANDFLDEKNYRFNGILYNWVSTHSVYKRWRNGLISYKLNNEVKNIVANDINININDTDQFDTWLEKKSGIDNIFEPFDY